MMPCHRTDNVGDGIKTPVDLFGLASLYEIEFAVSGVIRIEVEGSVIEQ
jgi:hypothetical protein